MTKVNMELLTEMYADKIELMKEGHRIYTKDFYTDQKLIKTFMNRKKDQYGNLAKKLVSIPAADGVGREITFLTKENKSELECLKKSRTAIRIHCYVDQLINNEDGKFDKFESAWFIVSELWAEKIAMENEWDSLEEFFSEYAYDNTDGWLQKAIEDGELLGCGTGINRTRDFVS